jgi:hypothetical protein
LAELGLFRIIGPPRPADGSCKLGSFCTSGPGCRPAIAKLALFRTSHFAPQTSNFSPIGFVCTSVFQPTTDYRLLSFGFVSHECSPPRHGGHGEGSRGISAGPVVGIRPSAGRVSSCLFLPLSNRKS